MRADPVAALVEQFRLVPGLAEYVTGDRVGREAGETMIYLEHSGGFRRLRDRADRADIEYDVVHQDRGEAVRLAYELREYMLEVLPGLIVSGVQVLDVGEISSPRYLPDVLSREHVYRGEVSLLLIEV
ncbi:hypothetical protein [Streptomyces luteireticuli]|uniref:DUF3168 domain-containing protein n=1 Tax=Streptomyces luteireticuli TaxID=173858 RepID=A0ABN0YQW7_9ACTN